MANSFIPHVLTSACVALVLFASVSYADPVLYTDDTLPTANITIGADGVEFQLSAAKTYAYTMSGSGAFYKTGDGTLTLNKNGSTFTGDVHLNGGKIKVTAAWTGTKSALGAVQAGRTIYVNSGTELIFNNQNIFNNAHNDNPVAIVADGGKISNEGAYYNFLQYVTLKNGANLHATDGNTTWEAYKLQNLNVVSNSDGSAATAPTITGANNNHAVISFGAKSSDVATSPSTIYVENITNNANSDLVISAKIVDSTTVNTGVRTPGEIIKTGAGTLELKNVNSSYSGNLTIKEGTVKVTAGSNADDRVNSALGASNVAGRTVTVNSGAVLELAAQDVMCDTHSDTKLLFVLDGGKITNSGAYFNFLQNVTLKNGANIYASNGNTNWEAYKIQNLRVERSGDAAASAVSLTAASGDHNVFTFGAISDNISTTPVSIYVEDITSANGASDAATDILISAKIVDANIDGKTKKAAPIVKSGAGTLELKNTGNTYSGNLTINEGTVKVTAGSASNGRTASALGANNVAGRLITVNEGAVLDLAVENVIVNAHTGAQLAIVVDGGQIINSGYNYLQNLTLKDGAQVYAANGADNWKSLKFHNLNIVRKSPDAADSPVVISSDLTNPNATIAFGDISNVIKVGDNNSISTVTVEEITSADPSVNDNVSDLVISAIIANPLHTTSGTLSNATQIVKAGAGTMELTAANTLSGKTTISEGTLKLSGDGTLGTGTIVNNATLELAYSSNKTFSNTVSGTGDLIKTGNGTLTLSNGGNSYTGDVYLDGGKISVTGKHSGSNSALGRVQADRTIYVNSGTELIFANQDVFTDAHTDNPVAIVVDGGKISNSGTNYNFLQDVTLKNGANIHAANGNATWKAFKFQNLSVVSNADGSAATAATITGANNTDAVISFGAKSSDVATLPSTIYVEDITSDVNSDLVISAKIVDATTDKNGPVLTACEIVKSGAGTLELKNINSSYSGKLTINEGTVKVTAGSSADNRTASALGASNVAGRTVTVNNGAVLELAAQDVICDTHANSQIAFVADGGQITNSGANFNFLQNVTLKNGANINASDGNANWAAYKIQNLRVERGNSGTAEPAATLTAADNDRAVFTFGAITDDLSTVPATIYVEDVTNPNRSTDALSDLVISAKIVDPSISGSAKKAAEIVKTGAGIMELTAANAYTGKTTISEGAIRLSGNGTLGSGEVAVAENATLEFAHESDQTFSNAISGTGDVTKTGAGTLTLSGADTYTGETTVSAGTLKLTGNAISALVNKTSGITTVEPDGTLEFNVNTRVAPVRLTISDANKIVSTGEVVKTGDGTLQLYSAASDAIDIRSLTVSSGRVEILGALTNGITVEPGSVFSPGVSNSASASVTDVPAVVGHRGNSSVAPENTLSAFRSCVESGAQGAECDVYRTKDGYLVLQHDSTLQRNVRDADGNPVEGRIADYTLDELLTMDFGVWKGEEFRGEKVATLDQYLDLLNGTNCAPVIELKQTGLEADTIAAVRERGMEDETTIIAFSEAAIKECRRLAPEIKAAWLCTKNSSETVDQYADRIIATLQELDTTYVDLESSPVTPELVQKLHDNGITVMTWTVDNPDRVSELYNMGIDSVTTNVPVTGMELLEYATGSIAFADNPVGEASFGGEFALNQGATLLLEQDENGMDKLTASSFDIDTNSILELIMGSFKPGAEYPIIVNSSGDFSDGLEDDSFWNGLLTPESDNYWNLFVRGNTVYASIEGEAPTPGSAVPDPSTWILLALGAVGLLYVRKRTRK